MLACGVPLFTQRMREIAIGENKPHHVIEFIESDYQPQPIQMKLDLVEAPAPRTLEIGSPIMKRQ